MVLIEVEVPTIDRINKAHALSYTIHKYTSSSASSSHRRLSPLRALLTCHLQAAQIRLIRGIKSITTAADVIRHRS